MNIQAIINELTAQRNKFADEAALARAELSVAIKQIAELEKKLSSAPKVEIHDLPANPYDKAQENGAALQ